MEKLNAISRRHFIEKAAVSAGFTALGSEAVFGRSSDTTLGQTSGTDTTRGKSSGTDRLQEKLPREVWIATVSQAGLSADTAAKMVQTVLEICNRNMVDHPDIICLPEIFMFNYIRQRSTLEERVDISSELVKEVMAFAKSNHCYMICPMITRENGKIYNSAVVIDRQGVLIGEYRKMYLPFDELEAGFSAGTLQPPVFKTDFGTIGIQICYDCNWQTGWQSLQQQGAEIVFWPSAYPGGKVLNARAFENKFRVVTSTRGLSKICDLTGDVIAQTSSWDRNFICAPINFEKTFISVWPYIRHFNDIKAKYGRKVKITNYEEENWTTIESLSPDVRVNDILKEFNILTFEQQSSNAETLSNQRRI